ncbi:MAG: hypothetical protein M3Q65_24515 [Chloroflexota bacterium]|nr:hypothetical protein [Chloroflexota bacterium]
MSYLLITHSGLILHIALVPANHSDPALTTHTLGLCRGCLRGRPLLALKNLALI